MRVARLAGDEGDRDSATPDSPVETEAGFELNLIIAWRWLEPIERAAVWTVRRMTETKPEDDILMAETVELKIQQA